MDISFDLIWPNLLPELSDNYSAIVVGDTFYSDTFTFNVSKKQIINGLILACIWYPYYNIFPFRALSFTEMKCWLSNLSFIF